MPYVHLLPSRGESDQVSDPQTPIARLFRKERQTLKQRYSGPTRVGESLHRCHRPGSPMPCDRSIGTSSWGTHLSSDSHISVPLHSTSRSRNSRYMAAGVEPPAKPKEKALSEPLTRSATSRAVAWAACCGLLWTTTCIDHDGNRSSKV